MKHEHGDAFTYLYHRVIALAPSSTFDLTDKPGYDDDVWAVRSPDGTFHFVHECESSENKSN
jgi:hypothetical protein